MLGRLMVGGGMSITKVMSSPITAPWRDCGTLSRRLTRHPYQVILTLRPPSIYSISGDQCLPSMIRQAITRLLMGINMRRHDETP